MLLVLLLFTLGSPLFVAQAPPPKPKKKPSAADLERQRQREQAYETVKIVWANAKNISDMRQRADICTRAFKLVWTREADFAQAELTKNFDEMLGSYVALSKDDKQRELIESGLDKLVRTLARKDLEAGQKLQQRFFAARRQSAEDKADEKRDLADTLNLASDLLESDQAQSIQLASRVLEKSFSSAAVQYLFELQRKDSQAADRLYRQALTLLATGRHYPARSAVYLSAYAFNERELIAPLLGREPDGKLSVGIFYQYYEAPREGADMEAAAGFMEAVYQFLQVRVLQDTGVDRADMVALSTNYFLVKKVKGYAQFYNLDPESRWLRYETAVTDLARAAGVTDDNLIWLAQRAEYVATRKPALSDVEDESALTRAAEEKDAKKRANLIVNTIMGLLRRKRFTAAEQNLDLLEDLTMRNQVAQIAHAFIANNAVETRRWDELSQRIAKMEDRKMKIYFWLDAVRVIGDSKPERELALSYLSEARKALETLDAGPEKAAGTAAALAFLWQLDPALAPGALNEIPKTINSAEKYQGEKYLTLMLVPPHGNPFGFQLKDAGFEACFAQAAKQDWTGADLAARNLQNKYLQAWARLAAAQALLELKA
jgi:hypothetical protein